MAVLARRGVGRKRFPCSLDVIDTVSALFVIIQISTRSLIITPPPPFKTTTTIITTTVFIIHSHSHSHSPSPPPPPSPLPPLPAPPHPPRLLFFDAFSSICLFSLLKKINDLLLIVLCCHINGKRTKNVPS